MSKKTSSASPDDDTGLFPPGADAGDDGTTPAVSAATAPRARRASKAAELPALPATYEAGVQELEALIARIESGQLPLDQLLSGYQRGAQLLEFCRSKLDAVEQQIRVLDGGVITPWSRGEGESA